MLAWTAAREGWGRVLVDEPSNHGGPSAWTRLAALIVPRTGREMLGGAFFEVPTPHRRTLLLEGVLAGRPLEEWTDDELHDFFTRYGVRWVLASQHRTRRRLERLAGARAGGSWGQWTAFTVAADVGPALVGSARVRARPDQLDVTVTQADLTVLRYRCLPTLLVTAPGVHLRCDRSRGDPLGFLAVEVGPGAPRSFVISNGGLGALRSSNLSSGRGEAKTLLSPHRPRPT